VCFTSSVSHGWSGTGPLLKKLSLEKPAAASTCCSDVQATSSPQATATESLVAGWLTLNEFAILEAVCDTLFPSLNPPAGSSEAVVAYYRRCARDLNLAQLVVETLSLENPQAQTEFRQLLALLASPAAGLLLTGSARPFVALSQEKRERYLRAMANSPLGQLRQGYQAMKRLAGFIYFSVPDAQGVNPNWGVLDYATPAPPPADAPQPVSAIAGIYSDKVYSWQGVMQSAYCDQFGHLDGNYGYKLEVPPVSRVFWRESNAEYYGSGA